MSMAGYTKLFNSILASTIWREDDKTRLVWITLLAMADKNGIAEGSVPGLADLARVTIPECESALVKLMSPDRYSRTTEHEGKRIEKVEGGWAILNHAKYRAKMSADERKEYNRLKQRDWRAKHASTPRQRKSITVNDSDSQSAMSAHTEADAETKAESNSKNTGFAVPACFQNIDGFTTALGGWIDARKKKKNAPTDHAIQLVLNKLEKRPHDAVEVLNMAAERGWSGIEWQWFDDARRSNVSTSKSTSAIVITAEEARRRQIEMDLEQERKANAH